MARGRICTLNKALDCKIGGCAGKMNAVSDSCLLGVAEQMNFMAVLNVSFSVPNLKL